MTSDSPDSLDLALDWLLRVQQSPDDGRLRAELAAWLASAEGHRTAYRQAKHAWRVTGQLAPPLTSDTRAAAQVPTARPRRRRNRLLQVASALLACCALLLLQQNLYLAWEADYRTAVNERRDIQLADGSRVILDAGSALSLQFAEGRRDVTLLTGQAYFQVQPDADRPFRVSAADVLVTVTGTAFNVDSVQAQVNVSHGSVRVLGPNGEEALLTAGKGVALRDGQLIPRDRPVAQIAAWREGRLILNQQRLADVVASLRPYLDGKVLIFYITVHYYSSIVLLTFLNVHYGRLYHVNNERELRIRLTAYTKRY